MLKVAIVPVILLALAGMPAQAEQETIVNAPGPASVDQADPAQLINRAAALVEGGDLAQARAIYERIERMSVDYKLETTEGNWVFPAEVARRGLKEIAWRSNRINLASAR